MDRSILLEKLRELWPVRLPTDLKELAPECEELEGEIHNAIDGLILQATPRDALEGVDLRTAKLASVQKARQAQLSGELDMLEAIGQTLPKVAKLHELMGDAIKGKIIPELVENLQMREMEVRAAMLTMAGGSRPIDQPLDARSEAAVRHSGAVREVASKHSAMLAMHQQCLMTAKRCRLLADDAFAARAAFCRKLVATG